MFWAVSWLMLFGFLSCFEFTAPDSGFAHDAHLSPQDISVDKSLFLIMYLSTSRIQELASLRGFTITLARPDSQICPVSAVLNYLHLRGNAPGPLFIFEDFSHLTRAKFSYLVIDTVKAAGWQVNFTSHSFRVGAVTSAALLSICPTIVSGQWAGGTVMRIY